MAGMREIKKRIRIIKQTRQITRAMKLISASKLKKARVQLERTLPFFDEVKVNIADILSHSAEIESIYFDIKNDIEGKKKGYLIFAGDKTLAGGYNHNICKLVESHLKEKPDSLLFIAGHTGKSYFTRKKFNVMQGFDYTVQDPTTHVAREITELVLDAFCKGEVDELDLVYTRMVSAIKLVPRVMKLLPLNICALREELGIPVPHDDIRLDEGIRYEPSPKVVLNVLISKYVKGIVYGALVEAFTSEQSARMTAMDQATSNANDMLRTLNIYYNKARQDAITKEISEIVGGAAAL